MPAHIDWDAIIEMEDNVEGVQMLACTAGGGCEIWRFAFRLTLVYNNTVTQVFLCYKRKYHILQYLKHINIYEWNKSKLCLLLWFIKFN